MSDIFSPRSLPGVKGGYGFFTSMGSDDDLTSLAPYVGETTLAILKASLGWSIQDSDRHVKIVSFISPQMRGIFIVAATTYVELSGEAFINYLPSGFTGDLGIEKFNQAVRTLGAPRFFLVRV